MANTIIVGVTDDAASRSALEWATERARAGAQPLLLVSVVGGAVGAVGEEEVVDAAVAGVRERLEATAATVRATGLPVEVRVTHGNPVAELIDASEDGALLVIGGAPRGHGRGRHGGRIAAGAKCPVVIVPAASTPGTGVIVGVDGSEVSDAAVTFAADEAARAGETLTVVSTWMPVAVAGDFGVYPDLYLADLNGITASGVDRVVEAVRAAHPDLDVHTHVTEGDPATVIVEQSAGARLVVVGSHGRGAFARFLLGSVSEEVVAHLVTATAVVR
ncbi:universal stress protein [Microbacterium sp. NPDC089189]|uniref:universal stress protein n=1 Tax=Microbacterium sp. NPDC089189 TaxID=3154972 RepID=UPI003424AEE2